MEIFKAKGRTYIALPREMKKQDALTAANEQFKEKIEELEIGIGFQKGDDLTIRRRGGNVWVVNRRAKA